MENEPVILHAGEDTSPPTKRGNASFPKTGFAVYGRTRFDRLELGRILGLYGRMVAAGEWRDYAIDFHDDVAVFSVFRRTSEMPLYRIEKRPRLKDRQGQYAVLGAAGQVLKRGHELATVLRLLERKLFKVLKDVD